MLLPLGQDERLETFLGALREAVRPVAPRPQALQARFRIPLQVLVAGLPTNPKRFAQLGDRKSTALGQKYKSKYLFH